MYDTTTPEEFMSNLDARVLSVLRYWDGLRGNRPVPARVEVSPADITGHLSRIVILERPRAETVRIRLAGAALTTRMGMELRGMPFRSIFELDDRAAAMDAAETAMVTPAVSILSLNRSEAHGIEYEGQLAILPLSDTRGGLTRAMAIYSEVASVTPYLAGLRGRFKVGAQTTLEIPESGPLPGLAAASGTGRITPQNRLRLRRAAQAQKAPQPAPTIEARDSTHHARPVFQVIDGGLA